MGTEEGEGEAGAAKGMIFEFFQEFIDIWFEPMKGKQHIHKMTSPVEHFVALSVMYARSVS